jgi:serine/threonine protein phosphatase PrpC
VIESRVAIIQYPANNPIEDRYKASQLTSLNAYAVSVFDGHGGWQLSEFTSKRLHNEIDHFLKVNEGRFENHEDYIQISIR